MSMALSKKTQFSLGSMAASLFAFIVTLALMAKGLPWIAAGFLVALLIATLIWVSATEESPEGGSS